MTPKNLKALRESLGMTQKDFASSLGIGVTTYNGYETGARDPKSEFWILVAQTYGVTIDYLMGFSLDPHKVRDHFAAKTEPPAGPEGQTGGKITLEESNKLLEALGYFQEGAELSDRDLAFLGHVIGLLDSWFGQRQ